jgi:hypothetical protein
MLQNTIYTSQKAFHISFTNINWLMVFREKITVLSVTQNPCKKGVGINAELLNVQVLRVTSVH